MASTSADVSLPPFPPDNIIELASIKDSKIVSVSVYSGRAEITRLFKFYVKSGLNQVVALGLPSVLDKDSFRVEGRGSATIHDVTISKIVPPPTATTSPALKSLLAKQKQTEKALARAQKSLTSLETYLTTVHTGHVEVSQMQDIVHHYDATAEEFDDKVTKLEEELQELQTAVKAEQEKLSGPTGNEKLDLKATIGVFSEGEGEVKIALIYAVRNATWAAGYDVRVDMQSKERPISLIYKGSITQDTGEDWTDVPLTLETATPTFGVNVPTLTPWTLSVYSPVLMKKSSRSVSFSPGASLFAGAAPAPSSFVALRGRSAYIDSDESSIQHRELQVSSKGYVSATFGVPGRMNIPSDNVGHNVTIVKLPLDATMNWVCVPKKDTRVHLKAKIKNASEFTLLPGTSSVYVDGSFISKSDVPLVSPDESFDCPLGIDPTIRVTYHPRIKKATQSGYYNKSFIQSYMQRITVHNAKSPASGISGDTLKIKIIDQFPVSEDSTISVKFIQPPLVLPGPDGKGTISASGGGGPTLPAPVKISSGVTATWDGADEVSLGSVGQDEVDIDSLGRDGKFCWICPVPPQAKVNVNLQYEVSAPMKTSIVGL